MVQDWIAHVPWIPLIIGLPLLGGLACVLWPARSDALGMFSVLGLLALVTGLATEMLANGSQHHAPGGWGAPLGIELHADGLSLVMLIMTALVALAISLHASAYFKAPQAHRFWALWLLLLASLNALFLSRDLFNLYVTLELTGLAAVALTALQGDRGALLGATRYLIATLLGSLCYLMGVVLLYHAHATVDIALLGERIGPSLTTSAAIGLISAGLLLKTAVFPLHFWLPGAHASAAAPVSALLSALVIKGSFYLLLRLWLELFAPVTEGLAEMFGWLGAAAMIWGSVLALLQSRLKLLIAYSTVAQIGYLLLALPLVGGAVANVSGAIVLMALSHALAKAAMFLAAGNLMRFGGHDRIEGLDRAAQRLPMSVAAFAMAGVSIMGLPPSGGFNGKWLLLEAALVQERFGFAMVMLGAGVLAAAYVFKVVGNAFTQSDTPHDPGLVPLRMQWAALLLAAAALLLGLLTPPLFALLAIGDPFSVAGGPGA